MDKDKNPQKSGSEGQQGDPVAGDGPDPKPLAATTPDLKTADPVPEEPVSKDQLSRDKSLQDKGSQDRTVRDRQSSQNQSAGESGQDKATSAAPGPEAPVAAKPANQKAAGKAPSPPNLPPGDGKRAPHSAGKDPGRGGTGKWVALLVFVALLAGGYYLWPLYGDRIVMFSDRLTSGNAERPPQQSAAEQPAGSAADAVTAEEESALEAQAAEDDLTPTMGMLLDEERSSRQAMASELRDQMADLQLQLNSHADRLRQLSTTSRDDWLLAEAEYLLRLASQRILTERQTANATALMESADVILRDMSDPALYPVRKALAEDITRIRMTEPVDREGIFLRIGALVNAVDSLDSLLPEPDAEPRVDVRPEPVSWYGRLLANARRAVANVVGLVRVERRDVPLQPLLTLEQEQVLRHNLKVILEQARLALLREEQAIYTDSLARASAWVGEHFADNARAAAFDNELGLLADQLVSQELPSVTPSLRALQAYIRLWHNRFEPAEREGEVPTAPSERFGETEDEGDLP